MSNPRSAWTPQSKLPCPQVLIDLYGLYLRYDKMAPIEGKPTPYTMFESVKIVYDNSIELAQATLTGASNFTLIQAKWTSLRRDIFNADTIEDWIKLIFDFREAGKYAQELKRISGPSRACDSFNAIASYIIHILKTNNHSHFNNAIQNRKGKIIKLDQAIKENTDHKGGIDVLKKEKKLKQIILELAYLEDHSGILRAQQNQQLTYLVSLQDREARLERKGLKIQAHDEANEAIPYALQEGLFKLLYCTKYQMIPEYSKTEFDQFEETAKREYLREQANKTIQFVSIHSSSSSTSPVDPPLPSSPKPNESTSVPTVSPVTVTEKLTAAPVAATSATVSNKSPTPQLPKAAPKSTSNPVIQTSQKGIFSTSPNGANDTKIDTSSIVVASTIPTANTK